MWKYIRTQRPLPPRDNTAIAGISLKTSLAVLAAAEILGAWALIVTVLYRDAPCKNSSRLLSAAGNLLALHGDRGWEKKAQAPERAWKSPSPCPAQLPLQHRRTTGRISSSSFYQGEFFWAWIMRVIMSGDSKTQGLLKDSQLGKVHL